MAAFPSNLVKTRYNSSTKEVGGFRQVGMCLLGFERPGDYPSSLRLKKF